MNSTEFAGISNNSWKRRPARKLTAAVLTAVSLMAALTAIASASAPTAVFSAVGSVLYAGPSPAPGVTYTESTFDMGPHDRIRSVNIITYNEVVTGFLGDGAPGEAVVRCSDHNSGACAGLQALLSGATATSVHTSNATLYNITPDSFGGIEVLSGLIRGKLNGQFTLSHFDPYTNTTYGSANGTTSLRIGKGSTATYACFVGGAPYPSLDPCIDNTGGMMVPIVLDVKDQGKFEVQDGVGTMSAIESIEGILKVNAQANLLGSSFAGSIQIPTAKAELAGS